MRLIEKVKSIINSKYLTPLKKILLQGASPKGMAIGIAAAFVIGLFPVVGTTTILITIFALLFRLNLPLMQLVNYTIFPLQIIIIYPLMKLGEIIFRVEELKYSADTLVELVSKDTLNAFSLLLNITLQAIGAWIIAAPVIAILLYMILLPIISKFRSKEQPISTEQ